MKTTLVLATSNRGKLKELRELLADLPVDVVSVGDVTKTPFSVVEDGDTFAANAVKKARAAATLTSALALADDSGLEVDALGGAPGVRSARYAGEHATDQENMDALVAALRAVNVTSSPARFRCSLALVDPASDAEPIVVDGTCEGTIVLDPRGTDGFGYDPLFVVAGGTRTLAELSMDEKNRVSHRSKALAAIQPKLRQIVSSRNV